MIRHDLQTVFMKKHLRYLFIIPVILEFVFIACKKENSSEGSFNCNKPSTAVAGPDQVITLPADSILVDGSASNDPDGTISAWLWKKISGPASYAIANSSVAKTKARNLYVGRQRCISLIKNC